jgi:hypothetical protein
LSAGRKEPLQSIFRTATKEIQATRAIQPQTASDSRKRIENPRVVATFVSSPFTKNIETSKKGREKSITTAKIPTAKDCKTGSMVLDMTILLL